MDLPLTPETDTAGHVEPQQTVQQRRTNPDRDERVVQPEGGALAHPPEVGLFCRALREPQTPGWIRQNIDALEVIENLTLSGYGEEEARAGDVLRVGGAVLRVTQPTERCGTIGRGAICCCYRPAISSTAAGTSNTSC